MKKKELLGNILDMITDLSADITEIKLEVRAIRGLLKLKGQHYSVDTKILHEKDWKQQLEKKIKSGAKREDAYIERDNKNKRRKHHNDYSKRIRSSKKFSILQ